MLKKILYNFVKNKYILITENVNLLEKYKERKKSSMISFIISSEF